VSNTALVVAHEVDDHLAGHWEHYWQQTATHRGGQQLLTLFGDSAEKSLAEFVERGECSVILSDDVPVGFIIVREAVIYSVYVTPRSRRQGIGRRALGALLDGPNAPKDGYALPGDRSTKSLYESMRWKARLLTMSGE